MSTTGERIRKMRQKHHLTLDDVARHLNVGRQAIYKYEHGTVTNIPLDNLEKMASLFGTSPEYLSCWTDDDSPYPHSDRSLPLYIPDTDMFRKIMENMSVSDYEMVMAAFDRTYNKMKEKGLIE